VEGKEAELDGNCKKFIVRRMIGKLDERSSAEILLWVKEDVVLPQGLKTLGVWLAPGLR
jgi:hypothetical protein